jgi:signal transduction histidine kinase/CheY-like chemotaxis protein
VLAESGHVLYSNAQFASLIGEPLESVVGGHINRFVPEAERIGVASLLEAGHGARRSRIVAGTGIIDVHLSLTTTVPSKGVGSLCLIVSDLRALLEARSERDAAERASHTKDEFLAMLAHELRNPLGAIRSAVGLLESADLMSGPAVLAREVIARQVSHLSRLTDDLLDVGRVVSGKIRLDRHPLDMAQAVCHVVATFTGDTALDRRIEVSAEPVWVDGDAVRLEQVFANIVANAVKYTPPGGQIRVSVRRDADEAVVSVDDSGFGIPPELLPSIFDMFVQGDITLDRARGGLGIGLTLVRSLVDLHGGSVVASSGGVGAGSTFTVRLPSVAHATIPLAIASPLPGTLPQRVLLVEDGRDAREMLRLLLEQAGHDVYEAEDGFSGVELMDRVRPDVAIIDIGLPGLDGYEVARRMRAHPHGGAMVLVALTGYGSARDHEQSAGAGFDHHLVKPVDIDALGRLLDERVAGSPLQTRTK